MSDIFVSYASEDRARAMAISKALEAEGWSVWWDRNIPAGRRFSDVIEEQIGKARCMVVLWSAVSVTKDWVVEEADDGKSRGILVPVFVQTVQPPRGFRRIEAADLSGWRGDTSDTAFRTLCQNIASVAGAPALAAAAAAAPDAPRAPGVDTGVPRQEPPPGVTAAPEGWRSPRSWMIAGALGILAVGTTIYVTRAPKGGASDQPPAAAGKPPTYVAAPAAPPAGSTKKAEAENPPPVMRKDVTPGAKAPPKSSAFQTRENPKDGLMYVYIPPGKFTMGCSPGDNECDADEKPPHEVTITPGFWLSQTPVTQGAYQRVMGNNPSNLKGARLPVEQVMWNQARAYCQAVGMRLPTEAEWEYAARAGSAGARYGSLDQIAWYSGNSENKTHEVGQKQPNAFALYDMLGNVWQWVEDDWAAYPGGTADSCPGCKVLRGGSWGSNPRSVRASYRIRNEPTFRSSIIGFRCAGEFR